jgi:hypothetical protein
MKWFYRSYLMLVPIILFLGCEIFYDGGSLVAGNSNSISQKNQQRENNVTATNSNQLEGLGFEANIKESTSKDRLTVSYRVTNRTKSSVILLNRLPSNDLPIAASHPNVDPSSAMTNVNAVVKAFDNQGETKLFTMAKRMYLAGTGDQGDYLPAPLRFVVIPGSTLVAQGQTFSEVIEPSVGNFIISEDQLSMNFQFCLQVISTEKVSEKAFSPEPLVLSFDLSHDNQLTSTPTIEGSHLICSSPQKLN